MRIYQRAIIDLRSTPQVFYARFYDLLYLYNHAHRRLELEKLLCLEPPRSLSGYFKSLLNPGDGFTSENEAKRSLRSRFRSEAVTNLCSAVPVPARRFQKRNGRYVTVSAVERFIAPYVTAIPQWTQASVRV